MRPLTSTAASALRLCARHRAPIVRQTPAALQQRRAKSTESDLAATTAFDSPFKGSDDPPTTRVPDFGKYKSSRGQDTNLLFQYFMVGTMGVLSAAGAKATIQGMLQFHLHCPRRTGERLETFNHGLIPWQTFWSICPRQRMSSLWLKLRSTLIQFQKAKT